MYKDCSDSDMAEWIKKKRFSLEKWNERKPGKSPIVAASSNTHKRVEPAEKNGYKRLHIQRHGLNAGGGVKSKE